MSDHSHEENGDGVPPIPFPFVPYDVQRELMKKVYCTLRDGQIGVFESPTGTGKSLILICAALQWLRDWEDMDEKEEEVVVEKEESSSSLPNWLASYRAGQSQEANRARCLITKAKRDKLKKRLLHAKYSKQQLLAMIVGGGSEKGRGGETKRQRRTTTFGNFSYSSLSTRKSAIEKYSTGNSIAHEIEKQKPEGEECDDDDMLFMLDDYDSDSYDNVTGSFGKDSDEEKDNNIVVDEDWGDLKVKQVIYASRTHSQTSQFVNEIKKTAFAAGIRCVTLGSRKSLCVNPSVVREGRSDASISDACLDLQQQKGSKSKTTTLDQRVGSTRTTKSKDGSTLKGVKIKTKGKGCPWLSSQERQKAFRDLTLSEVQDIEELAQLGRDICACPYYGVRKAVEIAQLIVMPYAVLLQESSRQSMGVELKGRVVIVDEAHNLIEAINAIKSVVVSERIVSLALFQLSRYELRYRQRLTGSNLFYITAILRVLRKLQALLSEDDDDETTCSSSSIPSQQQQVDKEIKEAGVSSSSKNPTRVADVSLINDFLFRAGIDNINIFKLERYMQRSQVAKKVMGFLQSQQFETSSSDVKSAQQRHNAKTDDDNDDVYVSHHISALQTTHAFLMALTTANSDGRVLVVKRRKNEDAHLKFILLNPSVHFSDIARQARAVVLIGGTMQPSGSLTQQLLPDEKLRERIVTFSCGHVVPPSHILPLCVSKGPSGLSFNFTFAHRSSHQQLDELGRLLINLVRHVPGGIVCFLPSYAYLLCVLDRFKTTGTLAKLNTRKQIFTEPKSSAEMDNVLAAYSKAANNDGALLLSVVGAKMSEGINFSDELARCVVMIGMPYPDKYDPELKEKLKYLDELEGSGHGKASQEYYQSIGRSIRHANDYASILLVLVLLHEPGSKVQSKFDHSSAFRLDFKAHREDKLLWRCDSEIIIFLRKQKRKIASASNKVEAAAVPPIVVSHLSPI